MVCRRVGVAAAAAAAALVALAAVAAASIALASSSSSSPKSFVKSTVSAHDIVIFSMSYCPYCKRAKDVFTKELELKKGPHVVELDQRDDGSKIQDALFDITGRRHVPHVFVHGKHIRLSELLNLICGDSDPQVSVHGKHFGPGALKVLLRLAKVENLVNLNVGVKDDL